MLQKKWASLLGKGMLLLATIIWGSSFFILKDTLDQLPTCFVIAVRFSIATLALLLVFPKKIRMSKRTLLHGVVIGIILSSAYFLQTFGLAYTTPAKNAFLTSTYVAMVPFMVWAFYKRVPPWYQLLSAGLSLVGVLIVSFGNGGSFQIGDLLTFGCGFFYALQIIAYRKYGADDQVQLVLIELATSSLVMWMGTLLFELPQAGFHVVIGGKAWVSIVYLAVFATCVAQFLQARGQVYVPEGQASLILSLESVFGTLFSVVFYHERIALPTAIGFSIIFVALLIGEWFGEFITGKISQKRAKLLSPEEETGQ